MSFSRSGSRASNICRNWVKTQHTPDAMSIPEQLDGIHTRAQNLCARAIPLPERGVAAEDGSCRGEPAGACRLDPQDPRWLEKYFANEVEPVLSPLGLDPARPFPRIQNKSLNFIVHLDGKDAFGRDKRTGHRSGAALPAASRVAAG